MSLRNLNRLKKLELERSPFSIDDQKFLELYEFMENPPQEIQMKALLIELKRTSLEELILKAYNDEEPPDEQAETG